MASSDSQPTTDRQQDCPTPNTDMDKRNRSLYHEVFEICPHLREKIIDFVIHEGGTLSRANASTCRLVQRSWHNYVTKSLTDSGEPLFQFNVPTNAHLSPDSSFNQFLDAYAPTDVIRSTPPFGLTVRISEDTTRKLLEKCLRSYTSGLVSLKLNFSSRDVQALELPENFTLPVLATLNLTVSDDFYTRSGDVLNTSGVQSILSACKKLKNVNLSASMGIPTTFGNLRLPDTITTLVLPDQLTFDHLDQLVRSNLTKFPPLVDLSLNIPDAPYDGRDIVFRMLDEVRLTLKDLYIEGGGMFPRAEREKTKIRFPIMTCLETCFVAATSWNWAEDRLVELEKRLPMIREIHLVHVTPTGLRKLVENSRLESAEEFGVDLIMGEGPSSTGDLLFALTKLADAFPNISKLHATSLFVRNDTPHMLHPVFLNMSQLKELSILFRQDVDSVIENPNQFWTLLFLGVSPEEITDSTIPCITKMAKLRLLWLDLDTNAEINFPDVIFQYGFLQMPSLVDLEVKGDFSVSPGMQERWDLGRRAVEG